MVLAAVHLGAYFDERHVGYQHSCRVLRAILDEALDPLGQLELLRVLMPQVPELRKGVIYVYFLVRLLFPFGLDEGAFLGLWPLGKQLGYFARDPSRFVEQFFLLR